ncbi:hypothetical protein CSPX01_17302 [Colletotrichum filicis]|nr:hypothetical protein CSPX01_17302 [Colletotrichum filicis]
MDRLRTGLRLRSPAAPLAKSCTS